MRYLDEETTAMLRKVALCHGYIVDRGVHVGKGSVPQLCNAIAWGEVATVLMSDEQRGAACRWISENIGAVAQVDWIAAEGLRTILMCLDDAAAREARGDKE